MDTLEPGHALIKTSGSLACVASPDVRSELMEKEIFVFDLDGTLYLGDRTIPGAREFVQELRSMGKQVFFVTNNSSKSVGDYFSKLSKLGFEPRLEEIVMSTHATISWLKENGFERLFVVGTPSLKDMLQESGFDTTPDMAQIVVLGFDRTFTFDTMTKACQLVHRGVPYIATHPDYCCPTDMGPEPDCGALIEMVRLSTGQAPRWVGGKPSSAMIREVERRVGTLSGMAFFGDRLYTDIALAKDAGISGVLVLSGEATLKDLGTSTVVPDYVVRSVAELRGARAN